MNLSSKYDLNDRVEVDGDPSIRGVITLIEWRGADHVRYEVSWFASGDAKFAIFDEWRLSKS